MQYGLERMRSQLYTAVVCDALDQIGLRNQSPRVNLRLVTDSFSQVLVGRCKTTLWADMYHQDPRPYELELQAVDSCQPDEVIIAAGAQSGRSGIWGELLTVAARQRGCTGAIIDGTVRDVSKMSELKFPVHARGTSPYDSLNRQRVIDIDVPVQIDSVTFAPGDLVFADEDGIVVVPGACETQVLELAFHKVHGENQVRAALLSGLSASEAFAKYGIL